MSAKKIERIEDLEARVVEELKDQLEFGRGNRLGKLAKRHDWIQDISNKERIECAKIRFGAVKEVLAYTKAKLKAAEATNDPNELEDLVKNMDEDQLAEYLGKSTAEATVRARDGS